MNGESTMSNSMFDSNVRLEVVRNAEGVLDKGPEFTVEGALAEEQEKYPPYLRVLVSVWQTKQDIEAGGSAEDIVARGLGVGESLAPGRWSARVTTVYGDFKRGCPATGLAHAVGNDGEEPRGFETYTWITRLHILEDMLLKEQLEEQP
jgi:hypothetical protein